MRCWNEKCAWAAVAHIDFCVQLIHVCVYDAVPVCVYVLECEHVVANVVCLSESAGVHTWNACHFCCGSVWPCMSSPKPWQLVNALQLLVRLWAAFCIDTQMTYKHTHTQRTLFSPEVKGLSFHTLSHLSKKMASTYWGGGCEVLQVRPDVYLKLEYWKKESP